MNGRLLSEGGGEVEVEEAAFEVDEDGELVEPFQLILIQIQAIFSVNIDSLMPVQVQLNLLRLHLLALPLPNHVDLQTLRIHVFIETEPLAHTHALTVDFLPLHLHRNCLGYMLIEVIPQVRKDRGVRQSKGKSIFIGLPSVMSVKIDVKMMSLELPFFFPEGVYTSGLQQHIDAFIVKPPWMSIHFFYILLLIKSKCLINALHYMLFFTCQRSLPLFRSLNISRRLPLHVELVRLRGKTNIVPLGIIQERNHFVSDANCPHFLVNFHLTLRTAQIVVKLVQIISKKFEKGLGIIISIRCYFGSQDGLIVLADKKNGNIFYLLIELQCEQSILVQESTTAQDHPTNDNIISVSTYDRKCEQYQKQQECSHSPS